MIPYGLLIRTWLHGTESAGRRYRSPVDPTGGWLNAETEVEIRLAKLSQAEQAAQVAQQRRQVAARLEELASQAESAHKKALMLYDQGKLDEAEPVTARRSRHSARRSAHSTRHANLNEQPGRGAVRPEQAW